MIAFQCECGAQYSAKHSSAGKRIKCKKCGGEMVVPAAEVHSDAAAAADETYSLADPPPTVPAGRPTVEFAIEESNEKPRRRAKTKPKAKAKVAQSRPQRTWGDLLTGDIRPLLIGFTLILLGIGFFALPIFAPPYDPEAAINDSRPIVRTSEKMGEGLFLAAYKTFGQAGVIGLSLLIGTLFIGGGIWALKYMEFEDDA